MGKNKEKNTGENLKNRMDKVENNEGGERSDVEEDKGRNKSNRSSRKTLLIQIPVLLVNPNLFWKIYLRM
jgi:hypothetical protein